MFVYLFIVFFSFGMYITYINDTFKQLKDSISALEKKIDEFEKLLNDDLK